MNEEDEKKDSEEELKEELERYEAQNQEAYDKTDENYLRDRKIREGEGTRDYRERIYPDYKKNRIKNRRRLPSDADIQTEGNLRGEPTQEEIFRKKTPEEIAEAEEGAKKARRIIEQGKKERGEDYDPNFAYDDVRLGASITTEIGLNLLLDVFSAAPPVQAVGSAWINYLAQKIRGEEDINKLEMTAASIASQIPLLGSFKGATKAGKFGKSIVQGGVTGAIEETGYSLGRGEEVNLPEAIAFGATVGGIFNAKNAPDAFNAVKQKLETGSDALLNEIGVAMQKQSPLLAQGGGINLGTPKQPDGNIPNKPSISIPEPSSEGASDYFRRINTDSQFKSTKTLLGKLPDQTEAVEIAENLLKHVDDGERGLIPGWVAERPTTRYKGNRTIDYTRSDGKESKLYLNYSASKGGIVAIDYLKRLETKLARDSWNVNSNSSLGKIADDIWKGARQKNKDLRALLKQLETDNPEEFRRIFGKKGVWYVEHLHAQNSPFWNKLRPFEPRDPENLMALGERNFPTLKTNLENHMYTEQWQKGAVKKYGTEIYVDYNPEKKTLQLVRADNDLPLYEGGGFIDGDTPQRNWQKALKDAEANIPQGDISDIAPDTDPVVDAIDKITETTAQRLPDVGTQPGISKANRRANLSQEIRDQIEGYEAEIKQAQNNLDVYYSQFEVKPVKKDVPTLGSKIIKTKDLTAMPLTGKDSVNSNKQLIVDRLQKIRDLEQTQGSLTISKPGVTRGTGTGLMTNVQEEVPTVQPDKKVKPKKIKRKKITDE